MAHEAAPGCLRRRQGWTCVAALPTEGPDRQAPAERIGSRRRRHRARPRARTQGKAWLAIPNFFMAPAAWCGGPHGVCLSTQGRGRGQQMGGNWPAPL